MTNLVVNTGFLLTVIMILKCSPVDGIFLIVPEDVGTAFVGIYGFAPKILTGHDHRVGFGFRFGNHADLQLMYEFGPQETTRPLEPIRARSSSIRVVRRRPLIDFLLRARILKGYDLERYEVERFDEPR